MDIVDLDTIIGVELRVSITLRFLWKRFTTY